MNYFIINPITTVCSSKMLIFSNFSHLIWDPQCHLGQKLRVCLKDICGVGFYILLQEEGSHVRRRTRRCWTKKPGSCQNPTSSSFLKWQRLPVGEESLHFFKAVRDCCSLTEGRRRAPAHPSDRFTGTRRCGRSWARHQHREKAEHDQLQLSGRCALVQRWKGRGRYHQFLYQS